jgi:hypothetical protein
MAGKRTPREEFTGEAWSDDEGTTYELEHNGRMARVRFYNSGELHFATKGDPVVVTMVKVGKGVVASGQLQVIVLQPQ